MWERMTRFALAREQAPAPREALHWTASRPAGTMPISPQRSRYSLARRQNRHHQESRSQLPHHEQRQSLRECVIPFMSLLDAEPKAFVHTENRYNYTRVLIEGEVRRRPYWASRDRYEPRTNSPALRLGTGCGPGLLRYRTRGLATHQFAWFGRLGRTRDSPRCRARPREGRGSPRRGLDVGLDRVHRHLG